MTRALSILAASGLALGLAAGSALAWSTDPAPSGGGTSSQFADPDTTVENFGNAAAAGGTEVNVQSNGNGSAHPVLLPPPDPADAEPVNPAWPAWMQWHQQ
ncbi:MAG TPA: hypothetical protein VMT54_17325 [Candidatus Cybelea sp.]|nr:hypothetical protein [Candidatus Cybelea sp.]